MSYSDLEQMVGRLVSLDCAVSAGMWYTRYQHAAMANSGVKPDSKKRLKSSSMIFVTPKSEKNGTCGFISYRKIKDLLGNPFLIYMLKQMFLQTLLEGVLLE